MTVGRPRGIGFAAVVLATIFGMALPGTAVTAAEEAARDDQGWSLRFYAAAIDFDQGSRGSSGGRWRTDYDFEWGGGFGVNAEYRFSRRLGVDLGALAGAGVDLVARTVQVGDQTALYYDTVSFTPVTAGLDIHLTPDARVDVYICPMLAWVSYGRGISWSEIDGVTTDVGFDDDLAPGLALGLGVPFGEGRWSFQANVTYLDSAMRGSGLNGVRVDSDYDMAIVGAGFGYRF